MFFLKKIFNLNFFEKAPVEFLPSQECIRVAYKGHEIVSKV